MNRRLSIPNLTGSSKIGEHKGLSRTASAAGKTTSGAVGGGVSAFVYPPPSTPSTSNSANLPDANETDEHKVCRCSVYDYLWRLVQWHVSAGACYVTFTHSPPPTLCYHMGWDTTNIVNNNTGTAVTQPVKQTLTQGGVDSSIRGTDSQVLSVCPSIICEWLFIHDNLIVFLYNNCVNERKRND